jgi:hypothetical protein
VAFLLTRQDGGSIVFQTETPPAPIYPAGSLLQAFQMDHQQFQLAFQGDLHE